MMTNREKAAIKQAAERINSLASLENACFSIDKEDDARIKDKIRPYMSWFEIVADHLDNLANADDAYTRKNEIEAILRYCQ